MKRETVLNRIRYYEGRLNSIRRENYKTDRDHKRALTLARHCRNRWRKMLDRFFPNPKPAPRWILRTCRPI